MIFMYTHSPAAHLLTYPTVLKKLLFLYRFIYIKSPALLLYSSGFPTSHQSNLYLFLELKALWKEKSLPFTNIF